MNKKYLISCALLIALSLSMLCLVAVCAEERQVELLGDANMDGVVNTGDAVTVLKFSAGIVTLDAVQKQTADANQNDIVNTADAVTILRVASGLQGGLGTIEIVYSTDPSPDESATPTLSGTPDITEEPTTTPSAEPTEKPTVTPMPDDYTTITLKNTSIECDGDGCTVNGTIATITTAGVYLVQGTLDDGRLIVEATKDDSVNITFSDANLNCSTDAPFYVKSADKVVVSLMGKNTVKDADVYDAASECKGAMYSEDDLTINGTGSLTVTSTAHNGIHCKNDLKINNAVVEVVAESGHGLRGNDSISLKNSADVTITAGKDGLQTDNVEESDKGYIEIANYKLNVTAGDDAVQADTVITVENTILDLTATSRGIKCSGSVDIISGRGSINSADDCIKADTTFAMADGSISIVSGADGIQSETGFTISGGSVSIRSTAAKGINANCDMQQSGGKITVEYSKEDSINTTGSFDVTGGVIEILDAGLDGIQADAGFTCANANISINAGSAMTSAEDSGKGIKGTTLVMITSGEITISSKDDAIHSNGTITINGGTITLTASDDGIHADESLTINDGNLTILNSYEGLESLVITINGGKSIVTASDDGVNAADGTSTDNPGWPGGPGGGGGGGAPGNPNMNCLISITGGILSINASGDGIDSNGNVTMSGGVAVVSGPTNNGNGALDFEGTFTITGGNLVACGSAGMVQYPRNASICTLNITFSSNQSGNQILALIDNSDNVICAFMPKKQFRSVIVCSAQMTKGTSYKLYLGGSYYGGTEVGGWYTGGDYTKGTLKKSFSTSSSSYLTQLSV